MGSCSRHTPRNTKRISSIVYVNHPIFWHPGKHEHFLATLTKAVMNSYFSFWSIYFQVVHSIIKTPTQCKITVIVGMSSTDILERQVPLEPCYGNEKPRNPTHTTNAPQTCSTAITLQSSHF